MLSIQLNMQLCRLLNHLQLYSYFYSFKKRLEEIIRRSAKFKPSLSTLQFCQKVVTNLSFLHFVFPLNYPFPSPLDLKRSFILRHLCCARLYVLYTYGLHVHIFLDICSQTCLFLIAPIVKCKATVYYANVQRNVMYILCDVGFVVVRLVPEPVILIIALIIID